MYSELYLHRGFRLEVCMYISSSHACYMFCSSHSPWFYHRNRFSIWWKVAINLRNLSLRLSLHSPLSSFVSSKYSAQQVMSSIKMQVVPVSASSLRAVLLTVLYHRSSPLGIDDVWISKHYQSAEWNTAGCLYTEENLFIRGSNRFNINSPHPSWGTAQNVFGG